MPPPNSNRHQRRKEHTRQKLLDAARQLIAARGYDSTGVLDITEAADVSKGTFYLYFKDKEELTRALIVDGFDELRARIDKALTQEPSVERVEETLRAVFHYAADNRDLFLIMLGSQSSAELRVLAFNYYTDVLESHLTLPDIAAKVLAFPADLLAQFIAGAVVHLTLWWLEDDHGLSPDEISEITFRLLRQGVMKPQES